ncbi:unnamed protein product, partial [Nesidiocoris tenuis]
MLWGYSPAQDLLGALLEIRPEGMGEGRTVNILLAACSDPRHILQTVAKFYTHDAK